MKTKFLLCSVILLAVSGSAFGQGAYVPARAVNSNINGVLHGIQATITVCAANTAGIPCAPPLAGVLFKDQALTQPLANPTTTDGNGNYPTMALAAGNYTITETATGFTGFSYQITITCGTGGCTAASLTVSGLTTLNSLTVNGTATLTGQHSFSNANGIQWVGSVATPGTPTIDGGISSASTPGRVDISPVSTSAESANLVTTSTSYQVYPAPSAANRLVVFDNRGPQGSVGNPTATPMYSIGYGQRCYAELTTECINYWATGTIPDSSVTLASALWVGSGATFPTNSGALQSSSGIVVLHDAVTIGSSSSVVNAVDGEAWIDPTSLDKPLPFATAFNGQTTTNRTNPAGWLMLANVYHATSGPQISSNFFYDTSYGFDGDKQVNAYGINYPFHSAGGFLMEPGAQGYDFLDNAATITSESESGTTATYTMAATCFYFTGQLVRVTGATAPTGVSNGPGYNVSGTVLTPGCNGGSTFTMTLKQSGLGTATGGTAQGIHNAMQFPGNGSVTQRPGLDTAGWIWALNNGTSQMKLNNGGLQVQGNVGCTSDGGCFVGENNNTKIAGIGFFEGGAFTGVASDTICQAVSSTHTFQCSYNNDGPFTVARVLTATSTAFATATTAGTCVQNTTAVTGATTSMVATASPVSTPGVGAQWSAFVSSAGNVTINECAVATSAGGTIAFNIRVTP